MTSSEGTELLDAVPHRMTSEGTEPLIPVPVWNVRNDLEEVASDCCGDSLLCRTEAPICQVLV